MVILASCAIFGTSMAALTVYRQRCRRDQDVGRGLRRSNVRVFSDCVMVLVTSLVRGLSYSHSTRSRFV